MSYRMYRLYRRVPAAKDECTGFVTYVTDPVSAKMPRTIYDITWSENRPAPKAPEKIRTLGDIKQHFSIVEAIFCHTQ